MPKDGLTEEEKERKKHEARKKKAEEKKKKEGSGEESEEEVNSGQCYTLIIFQQYLYFYSFSHSCILSIPRLPLFFIPPFDISNYWYNIISILLLTSLFEKGIEIFLL